MEDTGDYIRETIRTFSYMVIDCNFQIKILTAAPD